MPQLSLNGPLPADARLARVCQRTFTRLFRTQSGVSFGQWRQQVCLLAANKRLSMGQPVTVVAVNLGYASASAFAAAFRRVLGETPGQYMEANSCWMG
jgi:AraC-like DNA-binding protein